MIDWSEPAQPRRRQARRYHRPQRRLLQGHGRPGGPGLLHRSHPEDPSRPGKDNFDLAVASFGELALLAESLGAVISPSRAGRRSAVRQPLLQPGDLPGDVPRSPSSGLGINYDPSHLSDGH
jgi:hypothetical protein